MSIPKRDRRLQYEFLPAAEEIIETPAAPFGAVVIWLTTILLVLALAWAYLGQIDIVAVGNGRVSTEGSVKVVQSASYGVVKRITAQEGQRVHKGDVLVELDKTTAEKELATTTQSLNIARAERDILRRLAMGNGADDIINSAGVSDEAKAVLREFTASQLALASAKEQALKGSIASHQRQLQFNQQTKAQLEGEAQKLKDRQTKVKQKLESANAIERIRLQNELDTLEQRITTANSAATSQGQQVLQSQLTLAQAQSQSQVSLAETNSSISGQVIAQEQRIAELENNLAKAKRALEQTTITAPVDGTILALNTRTIGGVVNVAELIAQIVPDNDLLYIDVTLDNQDVGFVGVGQRVVVKVATYPFQRYGYLEGTVENISPDAIQDEKKGLVYKAKVKLSGVNSSKKNRLKLLPGMSVSAEITTGKRRIIEFFLDPLMTHVDDSLKVR
ncbi:HlyD family type I secretion periplasmic adaptor subunit [Candidatus Nanoperiomorbus periodonticus]|uniref:HlyD family type I secretion periplasmic adaptor subunit n=1 Tax=Candidatus Nanoperiomorbus periodonticus TaxID=2171989 RepID=UPI00101CA91A|nr:HlyD family type I secretion periplasmic adaptor subunit [Candidatus Nanoperiomorbus periodonticus]RYC76333.1 Hemolysin secretion protein D, chromosomal [Candidatus Nanoperiomorbus periodonticus]